VISGKFSQWTSTLPWPSKHPGCAARQYAVVDAVASEPQRGGRMDVESREVFVRDFPITLGRGTPHDSERAAHRS
jgi:hypothetical protein